MVTQKMQAANIGELPVFFIIGRGRSGSTLLRTLFDAHSMIKIPMESRFVQFLYYHYGKEKDWTFEKVKQAVNKMENSFEPLDLDKEMLFGQISKELPDLNFSTLCKLIYVNSHSEFPKKAIHLLGDKNPRYSFFLPQLVEIFPNAKFIHLVRDYRAHIVSLRRAGKNIHESRALAFIMGRWKLYNRIIEREKRKEPKNFYTLRFEDLVLKPSDELSKLCAFLEVEFEPEMLKYHERVASYFKDASFEKLHQSLGSPIDSSKLEEWKTSLSNREQRIASVLGGGVAERYGYHSAQNFSTFHKLLITIVYAPMLLLGQIRYRLKSAIFPYAGFMRLAYALMMKIRSK